MRILHVSDWHLGATLGRIRRREDHATVIDEMVAIADEYRPDLVIHTGDLFDHVRPGAEDMTVAIDALRRLAVHGPVVVLAGNHDSPALFEVFERLLHLTTGDSHIRFIPRARPPADGGILDFPVGDQRLRLAPLPFVHPNQLLDVFAIDETKWMADYTGQVRQVEQALGAGLLDGYDGARDVLLFAAHLHVGGASFSGSERPLHITEQYATEVDHLPKVSYAAFGHIHKPQRIPGAVPGEYAGSAIPINFGEMKETKRVLVVEVEPGRPAKVVPVPLSGGRKLIRLEGTLPELTKQDVGDAILDLTVHTDERLVGLDDQVKRLFPDAAVFDLRERVAGIEPAIVEPPSKDDVEPPLRDLFEIYLRNVATKSEVKQSMSLFDRLFDAAIMDVVPELVEEDLLVLPDLPAALSRRGADA